METFSYHPFSRGVVFLAWALTLSPIPLTAEAPDPRDNRSPWGIAPGAEAGSEYPNFTPLLEQAGIKWLRLFSAWNSLEPKQGEWTWDKNDARIADMRSHSIHTIGYLGFLARWASAAEDVRKFPIKDIQFWSTYVTEVAARYHKDIKYWEVWNEFNGGFAVSKDKARDYAELTRTAYDAVKKVDPAAKIGISCANFDLGFFDRAIKAGAADHFDYVCVHPYENLGNVSKGGEVGYLGMAANVRKMLADNKQRIDMPLWITEMGTVTDGSPEQDALQAQQLVKGYILSLAQGFEKVFWFEAMGPAIYGKQHNEAHGIIRRNGSPRPSFVALNTMTQLLGPEPNYVGWLNISEGGYGFLFEGPTGVTLSTWAPSAKDLKTKFSGEVEVIDMTGKSAPLPAGRELTLSTTPIFLSHLPPALVQLARENKGKPFPWGGDYSKNDTVRCRLGADIIESGIQCIKPEGLDVGMAPLGESSWRILDPTQPGKRVQTFRVHPSFLLSQPRAMEITVIARRPASGKPVKLSLTYESTAGYKPTAPNWNVPEGDQWQEQTWKIQNANFIAQWGYNLFLAAEGSGECQLKEIKVKRLVGNGP